MQAIAVEMPTVRVFVNLGVCLRGTNGAKGRRGEIERGEVREKVKGHEGGVTCVDYCKSRREMVSAGADGQVIVWEE